MQEEVTQKTIALSMKTGKLTTQVLQAALKKYLQHRAKSKNTLHHGQQSLKQLKSMGSPSATSRLPRPTLERASPAQKNTAWILPCERIRPPNRPTML